MSDDLSAYFRKVEAPHGPRELRKCYVCEQWCNLMQDGIHYHHPGYDFRLTAEAIDNNLCPAWLEDTKFIIRDGLGGYMQGLMRLAPDQIITTRTRFTLPKLSARGRLAPDTKIARRLAIKANTCGLLFLFSERDYFALGGDLAKNPPRDELGAIVCVVPLVDIPHCAGPDGIDVLGHWVSALADV